MAGVQTSALAVAVSNAGALGALPNALLSLDALRQELAAIQPRPTSHSMSMVFVIRRPFLIPSAKRVGAPPCRLTTKSMALTGTPFLRGPDARPSAPRPSRCWKPLSSPWSAFISGCLRPICWRGCAPGVPRFCHRPRRWPKRASWKPTGSMPLLSKGWKRVVTAACSWPMIWPPKLTIPEGL